MITYKKGNLLDTPDKIIAHGCNAQGVMGSGVAKAIRDKFPKAYEDYRKRFPGPIGIENQSVLGSVIPSINGQCVILNCITQLNYGKDGKKYVSYDAIDKCMSYIYGDLHMTNFFTGEKTLPADTNISMPKIGAGLGGGNWEVIEAIINHRLKDVNVTVWEL